MPTVFYDLETSDRFFCGQILNFAFIEVGPRFEARSEYCGKVKISRLQLPAADAILKNRTDVCAHQRTAPLNEREALPGIWNYLAALIDRSAEPVQLVGYNSSRFDLPYLRTSLIRNGLSPYFEGHLVPGDLLFAARKLAVSAADFPRRAAPGGDPERVSYSLENLGRQFGVLSGAQTHESRDDVLLTIALAKLFAERFKLDVRSYHAYEAAPALKRGSIVFAASPRYDAQADARFEVTPYALLDSDHRSALWVNLAAYQKGRGREALVWFGRNSSALYLTPEPATGADADHRSLCERALVEFKEITVRNFFPKSVCDIELDIYRLDFDAIEALRAALWDRDARKLKALKNPDAAALYDRHRIANYPWGEGKDARVEQMLCEYSLYRYGGKMHINKSSAQQSYREGEYCADYHATFNELIGQIEQLREGASAEDRALLDSLHEFYLAGDIYRVAGEKLRAVRRERRE